LVQGIFVGGVVASSHTVGTESVPENWRGAVSGLVGGGGAGLGALIASIVFLVTSTIFPGDAFAHWGWRVMFFSGLLSSLLGWFVFRTLEESPFWTEMRKRKLANKATPSASPLKLLFSPAHRKVLFLNLLITTGGGAGYYLTSGYMPTVLKVVNHVANGTASLILIASSISAFVAAVAVGMLSDVIGRKKTFLAIGLLSAVLIPILYLSLAHADGLAEITFYAMSIAFLGNAVYAPVLIFLNERFPTEIRATGTGLSWNIGFAIGGIMPTFVSLMSATPADIPVSLSIFTACFFVLFLIGALAAPETKGNFR
jgi:MFS family permease